jgi:hypothetical protein
VNKDFILLFYVTFLSFSYLEVRKKPKSLYTPSITRLFGGNNNSEKIGRKAKKIKRKV